MPGPLLFGFVIDNACVVWQERCSEQGSCWIYDNRKLSINFLVLTLAVKVVSTFFFSLATFLYKPPKEEKVVGNGTTNTGYVADSNDGRKETGM